jgi:PBP1b-binding outer membrane lipoprotein LpoB
MVAQKMIDDLLASDKFKSYSKELNKKPSIIVGLIRNKTSEHIDADNYIKKFELAIYNSNVADLVESDSFRDKLREERAEQQDFASSNTASKWGKEQGANLMLFGEMTSETDVYNKRKVVNYITTLFLTDIESNKRVWYGQEEIKKYIKN